MRPVCQYVLRRAAVILCALLALLSLAAPLYLESSRFQRFLQARVNTLIPGHLAWEDMDLSLLRGRIRLQGLTLTTASGNILARIPSLEANLDWTGLWSGELRFSSILADAPTLSIAASGQGETDLAAALIPQPGPGPETGGVPLNLVIRDCRVQNGALDITAPDLTAGLRDLNLRLSGLNLSQGTAALTAGLKNSRISYQGHGLPVSSFSLSGRLDRVRLSDLTITAQAPGIRLQAQGGISEIFETPVLDMSADLTADTRTAEQTLRSALGLEQGAASTAEGPAALHLTLKGTPDNPRAEMTAAFGPGSIREQPVATARLLARLENRIITLAPSQVDPGTGPVLMDGTIDLRQMFPRGFTGDPAGPDTLRYALSIRQNDLGLSDLAALMGGDSLAGTLTAKVAITGQGIVPGRITAEIKTDIEAAGVKFSRLRTPADLRFHALAHLADDTLDLTELSVTGPGISGSGKGRLTLPGFNPDAAALTGSLEITAPDLAVPAGLFDLPARGRATLTLKARGPLNTPGLVADLEAQDLSAYGVHADSLSIRGGLDNGVLSISNAEVRQKEGTIRAEGRMGKGPDRPMDFDLSLKDMAVADLIPDLGIRGRVSGDIAVGGTLNNPDITARIRHGSSRADLAGWVNLKDQTLDIRAAAPDLDLADLAPGDSGLTAGKASLDLRVRGTLASPELEAGIQVKEVGTERFPEISGAFSATLRAQGPPDTPAGIRAAVRLSGLSLTRNGQALIRVDGADAVLEEGRIRLAPTLIHILARGRMTLTCGLGMDGILTASARGTIPLEMAASLSDEIRSADGDIAVSLTALGPVQSPEIRGTLAFSDLSLGLETLEQTAREIKGNIQFTPETLLIDHVTGRLGQGQFRVTGNAGLTGGKPDRFSLALDASQVSLDVPDTLSLTLNSRLTLAGTPEESRLTGKIDLLEGRYYRDVDLNLIDLATRKTRKVRPVVQDTRPDFLKPIALNIHVARREPILVDNNLAYMTVSPDLTLRGTAHSPALAGRAGVDEGTIFFQKARFEVTRGTVDFANPYKIEPEINLTGETSIRSWTIIVTVSGTPEDLQLSFSSDPSETDADILSLIAFGKTTREMGTAQGSGQLAAAGAAASMVAGPLGETLKEATGLDEVDISMAEDDGSTGVRVSLGADLSRQLSVAYGVDIRAGETVQQVTTYYKLLEHLLMSGFQDTSGRFGGGLKYRLEFR